MHVRQFCENAQQIVDLNAASHMAKSDEKLHPTSLSVFVLSRGCDDTMRIQYLGLGLMLGITCEFFAFMTGASVVGTSGKDSRHAIFRDLDSSGSPGSFEDGGGGSGCIDESSHLLWRVSIPIMDDLQECSGISSHPPSDVSLSPSDTIESSESQLVSDEITTNSLLDTVPFPKAWLCIIRLPGEQGGGGGLFALVSQRKFTRHNTRVHIPDTRASRF